MAEMKVSVFPSSEIEALAYLYVQNQDLKGKTPTEIFNLYHNATLEIMNSRMNGASGFGQTKQQEFRRW